MANHHSKASTRECPSSQIKRTGSFMYFDDSKHPTRGFSLGALVICKQDPQEELTSAIRDSGFDPEKFEFKSSLPMRDNNSLQRLRYSFEAFMSLNCKIAICVVKEERDLGFAGLCLLKKALRHEELLDGEHEIFFDEGLFTSKKDITTATRFVKDESAIQKCQLHLEQDSKSVRGIQVADLVAHRCSTMLSEKLGFVNKIVKVDHVGWPNVKEIPLGFEMWAGFGFRNLFLGERMEDSFSEGPNFLMYNVEPFGLFIHESLEQEVADAAHERFAKMYFGCIH